MNNIPNTSNDISNNDTDLSNEDDSVTNMLHNIYTEVSSNNSRLHNYYGDILNNHDMLRDFFNNNLLNNIFNDINPLLLNTENESSNLNDIFNNLLNNTNSNNRSLNNVYQDSLLNDKPKYKHVLSDKGKQQLKNILFKDSSKYNNSCPIYYTDFQEDDNVIELPCKHCFTPEAIEKWLKEEQALCPVCRFKLDSKEEKIKESSDNYESDTDSEDSNDRYIQMAIIDSIRDI